MRPINSRGKIMAFSREKGAVLFLAVGFMMLAVLSLALVVDTGRLYMSKRNLQRVADMAAIEVLARKGKCSDQTATQYAQQSLTRNNFVLSATNTLSVSCGQVGTTLGIRELISSPIGALIQQFESLYESQLLEVLSRVVFLKIKLPWKRVR